MTVLRATNATRQIAQVPLRLARALRRLPAAAGDEIARRRGPRRLVYWRPGNGFGNFGDELSPIIVRFMLEQRGIPFRTRPSRRLTAIGSILSFAKDGDVVWGTGVNWKARPERHQFRVLDVRAVRGPLTREFLLDRGIPCPAVYGDPGLLTAKIFPVNRVACRRGYVVVPNLYDLALFVSKPNVISPMLPLREVLTSIANARLVIASSLHGIIVADSYGVPARLLLPLGHSEHIGKYEDYYKGTGRSNVVVARTLDEALEMGGVQPPVIDAAPLEAAFPWDLYSGDV